MLFVEALRTYAASLPPSVTRWLAGLRDPQIGKCIGRMPGDPARAWTVDTLAAEVHMSRSVLAERFAELASLAPMQYLKRWRLATTARLLRDDRHKLQRIAAQVGYESEAAFSRAFKREHGASPGSRRRGWRVCGHQAPFKLLVSYTPTATIEGCRKKLATKTKSEAA